MATNTSPPVNISETIVPEYDLQALLHKIQNLFMGTIRYKWVRGHQDELKETKEKIHGPFQQEVQLNIMVDKLASDVTSTEEYSTIMRPVYSTTVMGLYDDDGIYVGDIKQHLTEKAHQQSLIEYVMKKHGWNQQDLMKILWDDLQSALRKYKPYYQTRISQLMHDWQYIGERKQLMFDKEVKCPTQCGEIESKMHYLWCKDSTMCTRQEKALNTLLKQTKAMNAYPGITTALSQIFRNGYNDRWINDIDTSNEIDKLLKKAI